MLKQHKKMENSTEKLIYQLQTWLFEHLKKMVCDCTFHKEGNPWVHIVVLNTHLLTQYSIQSVVGIE